MLCINVSLSGDYQLPDDGVLVSGVYWLSLHPHVERFHKKVTIAIQHSACVDDSALSFATTEHTQESPPYLFKLQPGGTFSHPNYGILETHTLFSAFAITASEKTNYAFCTYYLRKQANAYEVHITVTPNLEIHLKVSYNVC